MYKEEIEKRQKQDCSKDSKKCNRGVQTTWSQTKSAVVVE
jgi:hypothetical protein